MALALFVQNMSILPRLLSSREENHEMVSVPGGSAGHMSEVVVFTYGPRLNAEPQLFWPCCIDP